MPKEKHEDKESSSELLQGDKDNDSKKRAIEERIEPPPWMRVGCESDPTGTNFSVLDEEGTNSIGRRR